MQEEPLVELELERVAKGRQRRQEALVAPEPSVVAGEGGAGALGKDRFEKKDD